MTTNVEISFSSNALGPSILFNMLFLTIRKLSRTKRKHYDDKTWKSNFQLMRLIEQTVQYVVLNYLISKKKQDGYVIIISIEYTIISKAKHNDDKHGYLLFN